MRKFLLLTLLLSLVIWMACGSDDDGGDNGTGPTGPTRLVSYITATAPSMTDPDDNLWDSATSVTVDVTSGPFFSSKAVRFEGRAEAAVTGQVDLKAIYHQGADELYVRLSWADATHDVWPDRWAFDSAVGDEQYFTQNTVVDEDQLTLMYAVPDDTIWDVWYWRALTTGTKLINENLNLVTGLAEGFTLDGDSLILDTVEAQPVVVARDNTGLGIVLPRYVHQDTSDFNGYFLYVDDQRDLMGQTPPAGWTLGQFVPGKIIDSTAGSPVQLGRGSQWDIFSVSKWDGVGYSVVLRRALTSFSDDLDMAPLDSVKVRVGVANNFDFDFGIGFTEQGFSPEFWLIL